MEDNIELGVGTRVEHDRFGEGIIYKTSLNGYEIIFERGGKMSFSKINFWKEITVLEEVEDEEPKLTLNEVTEVLTNILEGYDKLGENVEIADKWVGGTLVLKPGNSSQPKEIPVDVLFHKIVMIRDKLRVLEQNINSHKDLSEQDKINIQKYITGIYGSLTTFNLLFKDKNDYFVGTAKKED
ncbi:MAG: hypothetical protein LBG80_14105 [Bacteroidales bacterium]|nr:hypothetical protein [Bacteroidales bacterium]